MPEVYIVGVGPGSPEYLTPQARDFVKKADSVLGWELDLLPIRRLIRGKRIYLQDVTNYVVVTARAAEEARQLNLNVAVPRIGDPCLSSGLTGLLSFRRRRRPPVTGHDIKAMGRCAEGG